MFKIFYSDTINKVGKTFLLMCNSVNQHFSNCEKKSNQFLLPPTKILCVSIKTFLQIESRTENKFNISSFKIVILHLAVIFFGKLYGLSKNQI